MRHRFTDVHQHLAYGVDDGPRKPEQMYKMLEKAARQGIGAIIATPHVTPGVRRFHREEYEKAVADARAYCAEKGLEIEILTGCEILYTDQAARLISEGHVPTLNYTDYVLVEFSPDIKYAKLYEALEHLVCEGYRPVIAHVERYQCLVRRPARAERLKRELEVRYQINCSSIINYKGLFNWYFVNRMLRKRLVDAIGTDAHNTSTRPANMKEAWRAIKQKYGARYARRLTDGSFLAE